MSRRLWARAACASCLCALAAAQPSGCGGRTGLDSPPPPPPEPECLVDADCPGFGDLCSPVACAIEDEGEPSAEARDDRATRPARPAGGVCVALVPVDCDDDDPCTKDVCDPGTGQCGYSIATLDNDGDGHRAPLPGTQPGAPGACGDDCDDTSAAARPGGVEQCDGVDNDCNGVVDDGATFVPLAEAVRVSGAVPPTGPGGLAWSGSSYAAIYWGTDGGAHVYGSMLSPTGDKLPPGETQVTLVSADAYGGPVVWAGDRYGVAWSDRRNDDYEVFFTLLDASGKKVIPDAQVSFGPGYSIGASMAYNGLEFVTVWQDARDGLFNLFAQRISIDGTLIGDNVPITESTQGYGHEAPIVAAGSKGVGVTWSRGDAGTHFIYFQAFAPDLSPLGDPIELTDGSSDSVFPHIVYNQDRYVIAWFDRTASPKGIYAAVVSDEGAVLVPPKLASDPGPFRSRYPHLEALGDRVLLLYADDRDQNDGYELYARMLSNGLAPLTPEQRLTFAGRDSINPIAAFGPQGNLGILFRDDRDFGEPHVFFMRLACAAGE